jgi:DNA-binding NarL/FixJ family response regulator
MIGARRTNCPLRLLIVDDQRLVAQALEALLRGRLHGATTLVTTSWELALRAAGRLQPHVVLADPLLPETVRFQTLRSFARAHPGTRLVVLDDVFRPAVLRIAIASRACGYWSKQASVEQLAAALPLAAQGIWTACPEARDYVARERGRICFRPPADLALLTRREMEVLSLLAQGLAVKECAVRLRLSPNTVDNHKSRLMKKLDLHRLPELILWATREGLVSSGW